MSNITLLVPTFGMLVFFALAIYVAFAVGPKEAKKA